MKEKEALQAKGLMEELILSIITDDNAKSRVSFKYVSPEWIGSPGWYFWPKDRSGVFYIKVDHVAHKDGGVEVVFDLYYYPHPDEDVFADFSYVEQVVRVSELFSKKGVAFTVSCPCQTHCEQGEFSDLKEGKGVPVPQYRESISPWLYRIGVTSSFWKGNELQEWGVEAQLFSRTWGIVDKTVPGEDGGMHVMLDRQGKDRDVPAWELAECFCVNLLTDLEMLGMTKTIKEKRISKDPYATNTLLFSLANQRKDGPGDGRAPTT